MQYYISKTLFVVIFTFLYIEINAKLFVKRSLRDVKCLENRRFYRNPESSEDKAWTSEECSRYYLCLDGDVFEFRCSAGLLFDVNRQLCDDSRNVHNCDLITERMIPKPTLERAVCANETHLGCADGNCIPAEYFCDGSTDCLDSSDEGWCDGESDPNAAPPCDHDYCKLPECFCSNDGTAIPGGLDVSKVPQMIILTFDGAVNHENWDLYTKNLLIPEHRNPNRCGIKATFFVSHPYTNYRHVQKLWNDGHEIAVNSITQRGPADWWAKNATIEEWFDEMVGEANIINRFGGVRMEDLRGMRVPHLAVGWNRQFLMQQEFGFVYDSSVVGPRAHLPLWPYTLDYKIPHQCTGDHQYCPTRSYPGLWEMVVNQLSVGNSSCITLDKCPHQLTEDGVYSILSSNFKRHYLTNRAPFGVHLNATWLKNQDYLQGFKRFFNEMLKLPNVYFVTNNQAIAWMRHPTPVSLLSKLEQWQCKPQDLEPFEIACQKPNTCKLASRVLEHNRYMITCYECPKSYPWIRNEFGIE